MTEGKGPANDSDPVEAASAPVPTESTRTAEPAQDAPPHTEPAQTEPSLPEDADVQPRHTAPAPTEAAPADQRLTQGAQMAEGAAADAEEVEPELIEPANAKPSPHHPPPPPSLRFKSAIANRGGEQPGDAADRRFQVAGNPKVARDLMTRQLFTIGPDDTLEHLEEHMAAFRFRHLPVVEGDKLVGLITHRDLLHASSSFLSERAKERDEIIHKVAAKRIMQRELVTARPTTPLHELALKMWQAKIGCVLVTDEHGTLLGIVTEADFIRLAHHFLVEHDKAAG